MGKGFMQLYVEIKLKCVCYTVKYLFNCAIIHFRITEASNLALMIFYVLVSPHVTSVTYP